MNRTFLIIGILLCSYAFSQNKSNSSTKTHENGAVTGIITWENPSKSSSNSINLKGFAPVSFTSFAIGFSVSDKKFNSESLIIKYRTKKNDNDWCEWKFAAIDYLPSETTTGLYWTDLLFNPDQDLYHDFEFVIENALSGISLIRAEFISEIAESKPQMPLYSKPGGCPPFPTIINRDIWLHPYYAPQTYTPTTTYPTHVVVHHGASPDTYTDGAAVVRSYWNYHVNTLHWSDIGYNYLGDKYGNLYQGRKNDDMQGRDVNGAHAGASNPYSIGINFLGNADVTTPTTVQLNAYFAFLGWWFDTRGFDPLSSASFVLQSGGTSVVPRILGHKDTNIGGTACPGTVLYSLLPSIRSSTNAVIEACMSNPVTEVNSISGYQTSTFPASFTDTDQEISFYQVLDNNGIEWRANGDYGFINDNFQLALHTEWTSIIGSWAISAGHLSQTDEVESNTNLYIPVNQTSENVYLYHFQMKISGSGTNRRAGLHFFCDNAEMTQRNNSYMIYFRTDNSKCQIYKAVDDNITLYTDDNCTVTADQWYDYKILFNTTTGEIKAFQNNVLVSSWTDTSPFTSGEYLSLRTGNCNVTYDDVKVYKSRTNTENITIGSPSAEVRYQNSNPDIASCRIKSVVISEFNRISNIASADVNIDWTAPEEPIVNDGLSTDIDTFFLETEISGSWSASSDPNSGIDAYFYCIGDSPGSSNLLGWTNNGLSTSFTNSGLVLSFETTYFVSVKILNNAGLESTIASSDGQFLKSPAELPVCGFQTNSNNICEGQPVTLINTSVEANSYLWLIEGGIPETSTMTNPVVIFPGSGTYEITLYAYGPGGTDSLTQNIVLDFQASPISEFFALDTLLAIPGAFATFVNQSENAENYLWTFGDGGISTDENPWHLYEDAGYFNVRLISDNSYCSPDTLLMNSYIHVIDPTELSSSVLSYISLYPIPFTNMAIIEFNEIKPISIEIMNLEGKLLQSFQTINSDSKFEIKTESFEPGLYFFRMLTSKGEIVLKGQKQ